jgi:hypothetical protein
MKRTEAFVLLLTFLILISIFPVPARAAPTLRTDQSLYTTRDKQVTLIGSGLSQGLTYYIWISSPADNKTHSTGTSFSSISGGLTPPGIVVPIAANASLGTYQLSLSTSSVVDNSQSIAHFGVWGTLKPLYQRTQTVMVMGGGLFPGTSLKLTIRNPAGTFVEESTAASASNGDFNSSWRIPEDGLTDVYTIFVDGTGTYDNPQQDYVSQFKFTVTQAVLSVKVAKQPNPVYQRTEEAAFSLGIQYPDGSPVVKSKTGITPIVLIQNQTTINSTSISLADAANGIWGASAKILANATPSQRYRFELPAMAFDDGFGNIGASSDIFSDYFQVKSANLVITSEVNGTQIQIPFGQVSIISKIAYPDGTPLTNGTVTLLLSTGSAVSKLKAVYDPTIRAWRASYSSNIFDLLRVGTWTLRINATDSLGNSGTAATEVTAQPYLFVVLLAVVIALVLFVRWTYSRYGRRTYFRLRKLVQRFRPSTA